MSQSDGEKEGEEVVPEYVSDESEAEEPREPKEERETVQKAMQEGLKHIAKTGDNDGFAFSTLEMPEKELRKLFRYLRNYPHLKYINIAQNAIRDIKVIRNIPYLIKLEAQENKIEDISIFTEKDKFTYLQLLNLAENRARELPDLYCPRLKVLDLSD